MPQAAWCVQGATTLNAPRNRSRTADQRAARFARARLDPDIAVAVRASASKVVECAVRYQLRQHVAEEQNLGWPAGPGFHGKRGILLARPFRGELHRERRTIPQMQRGNRLRRRKSQETRVPRCRCRNPNRAIRRRAATSRGASVPRTRNPISSRCAGQTSRRNWPGRIRSASNRSCPPCLRGTWRAAVQAHSNQPRHALFRAGGASARSNFPFDLGSKQGSSA